MYSTLSQRRSEISGILMRHLDERFLKPKVGTNPGDEFSGNKEVLCIWGSVLDRLERVVKILRRHVRQTSWIQRNLMSNFKIYEGRLGLSGVDNLINR